MAELEKLRKKRKRWTQILAPAVIGESVLGESYIEDPLLLKGKMLKLNLFTIFHDIRKQQVNLTFTVADVQGSNARTEILAYWLSPSYIKRIVRRKRDRIDDSFTVKTSDGILVRVKPTLVTQHNTTRSVRTDMLKAIRAEIREHVHSTPFDETVKLLLENRFQRMLKEKLSKLHPVKSMELRYFGKDVKAKGENIELKLVKQTIRKPDEEDIEEDISEKIKQREKEKGGDDTDAPEASSEESAADSEAAPDDEAQDEPAEAEEAKPKTRKKPAKKKAPAKDDASS